MSRGHKGRCFRDRRRTKARKEAQAKRRAELRAAQGHTFGYRERNKYAPGFGTGPELAMLAANALLGDRLLSGRR